MTNLHNHPCEGSCNLNQEHPSIERPAAFRDTTTAANVARCWCDDLYAIDWGVGERCAEDLTCR